MVPSRIAGPSATEKATGRPPDAVADSSTTSGTRQSFNAGKFNRLAGPRHRQDARGRAAEPARPRHGRRHAVRAGLHRRVGRPVIGNRHGQSRRDGHRRHRARPAVVHLIEVQKLDLRGQRPGRIHGVRDRELVVAVVSPTVPSLGIHERLHVMRAQPSPQPSAHRQHACFPDRQNSRGSNGVACLAGLRVAGLEAHIRHHGAVAMVPQLVDERQHRSRVLPRSPPRTTTVQPVRAGERRSAIAVEQCCCAVVFPWYKVGIAMPGVSALIHWGRRREKSLLLENLLTYPQE